MQIHDRKIAEKLAEKGYGYLQQPSGTRAAPYATDAGYCRGAADASGGEIAVDHRHMNAAFGLELLSEYAHTKLDLPVRTGNG